MKKFCGAALVVALACALVAPAGAAPAKLHSKVLRVSQLPKGWLSEGASSTEVFGCPASAFPGGSSAKATAGFNFEAPKAFPLITEVLATFANASSAYATLTSGLAGCAHVSGTLHGTTFTGTVATMSLPSYANQSAAFDGHVTLGGSVIVLDVLVVRKGNECMELEEANNNAVSASGFRAVAASAVAKL